MVQSRRCLSAAAAADDDDDDDADDGDDGDKMDDCCWRAQLISLDRDVLITTDLVIVARLRQQRTDIVQ